jgi:uncharacterized protein (TIGR02147 family)
MEPQVFQYHDPVEFLNASIQAIQARNPRFSLRAWASQLGLSHVAMLSMVLNRKRRLLPTLSSKISKHFASSGRFTENEARYFDILVMFHNSSTLEEKNFYEGILSSLKPDRSFSTLELDKLNIISEWYHAAILEMTDTKNFKPDPRWISLRLGDSVSPDQVKAAIERLLRLGLLERTRQGSLKKTNAFLATPTDVPDKSLKKFHSEMIMKAVKAMETQAVEKRDITSYTFSIDTSKLPEAKLMIRDFRRKLAKLLESPTGDSVYQLNIELFDLLGDKDAN